MKQLSFRLGILLVLVLDIFVPRLAFTQEEDRTPISVSLGSARTEAEAAAVRLAIEYFENIGDIFITSVDPNSKSGRIADFTPEIKIQTGEEDAFNGIIAKISGNYLFFKTTDVCGAQTPDSSKAFTVIPVSVGFETDRRFNNLNLLTEVGYVPWGPKDSNNKLRFGLNPRLGIFVQAGYKFKLSSASAMPATGGAADESSEKPDSALLRLKAAACADLPLVTFSKGKRTVRLILAGAGWYDIKNSEFYHELDVILRLPLSGARYFDLQYENGSGAPSFNKGNQFSANLTIVF
jgi:hypothetical protein